MLDWILPLIPVYDYHLPIYWVHTNCNITDHWPQSVSPQLLPIFNCKIFHLHYINSKKRLIVYFAIQLTTYLSEIRTTAHMIDDAKRLFYNFSTTSPIDQGLKKKMFFWRKKKKDRNKSRDAFYTWVQKSFALRRSGKSICKRSSLKISIWIHLL